MIMQTSVGALKRERIADDDKRSPGRHVVNRF
jgi:hypothetical protein